MRVGVIDYGAGNLKSVCNALKFLGADFKVVQSSYDFDGFSKLILPGVGSFGDCIKELQERELFDLINKWILNDNYFLGICVGYQILFEASDESPDITGLSFFSGTVKKFDSSINKVPQIGWNSLLNIKKNDSLFNNIDNEPYFYFVHSFYTEFYDLLNNDAILCQTDYGLKYASASRLGNVIGTQFHVEKSQKNGINFLNNFLSL